MLIAAGRAQAATVDSIGEHLLACLARCGSSVELGRQFRPRLGEIPFLVFRAGFWLHWLFGHDARRSLPTECFAVAASRSTSSQRLSTSACRLLSTSGPVFPCATAVMYACR